MQDMVNEADDFLNKITDPDIKACAKLLLVSCYAYMNDYIGDNSKKTYANLSTLIKYELLETEYESSGCSKLNLMLKEAPDRSVSKRVYKMYSNCLEELKKKAQMHLMTMLLTYHIK